MSVVMLLLCSRAEASGVLVSAAGIVERTRADVLVAPDEQSGTTEVLVHVSYRSTARELAWLLPHAAGGPLRIGSAYTFDRARALTDPEHAFAEVAADGACGAGRPSQLEFPEPPPAPPPQRGRVSDSPLRPQESTIFGDRAALEAWLRAHNFAADEALAALENALSRGLSITAFRYVNDREHGDLEPVAMTIAGGDARVLAFGPGDAALWVLSNRGRAVPKNDLHLVLDEARINWLHGGANYRALVDEATSDAGARAFVTELAGDTTLFDAQIRVPGAYERTRFSAARTLGEFLLELAVQGFFTRRELGGVLERNVTDEQLRRAGIEPFEFRACAECFLGGRALATTAFDPLAAIDDLERTIVAPENEAQALFDRFGSVTRWFAVSRDETEDIELAFREDLADVSRRHEATLALHCGFGGAPGAEGATVHLSNGLSIKLDASGRLDPAIEAQLPAAERIENLFEGRVLVDNGPRIRAVLLGEEGGCSCSSARGRGDAPAVFAIFALLTAAGAARSRSALRSSSPRTHTRV